MQNMSDDEIEIFLGGIAVTAQKYLEYAESIKGEIKGMLAIKQNKLALQFFDMVLEIGLEYFNSANDASLKGRLLGAAASNRSAIENVADVFYIISENKNKKIDRAKKYVDSYEVYRKTMEGLDPEIMDISAQNRIFKKINPWTTSSIEDRMKHCGLYTTSMYDWLSHFSHPNPGSLMYYRERGHLDIQCKMVTWFNCLTLLLLLRIITSDLKTISVTPEIIQEEIKRMSFDTELSNS